MVVGVLLVLGENTQDSFEDAVVADLMKKRVGLE